MKAKKQRAKANNKKGSSVVLLPFYCYAKRSCVLVEASGLEPPTPTLSGWCSNLLSYASIYENEHDARFLLFTARGSGGDERDRTADPLLARQVLSQLSYTPMSPRARILYHF